MTENSFRDSVADALKKLATSEARTKSARFREVFPDIEKAMKAGVSRKAILKALNESGLELTMSTLDTNLRRSRAKSTSIALPLHQPGTDLESVGQQPDSAPQSGSQEPDEIASVGSHSPDAINRVLGAPVDLEKLAKSRKTN
ncbi:hypothetical protein OO256_26735 [Pseudomonas sp. DCB_CB]|uniref:hypothetical protein n=1 Tax=unclassified Pseudomonas TaxID=196821 RepID=UPI002248CE10|nr:MULTISPECIES: hypothetical protein [unclassified Pseudomonas]MCX2694488.1 hypothetical protein [Pseudomonas sp. DCB_BZ]MCX2859682.1 hypothetical protein [Pseudomonas sp. DCB_CB]